MPDEREPHPDGLMTTGEAARVLALPPDMVRWLEREGRLPAQRTTNGVHLFRRSEVGQLATERSQGAVRRTSTLASWQSREG